MQDLASNKKDFEYSWFNRKPQQAVKCWYDVFIWSHSSELMCCRVAVYPFTFGNAIETTIAIAIVKCLVR